MAEVLLNSGSLRQFAAIGDEGQPIYSVAAQLRETVRLKVSAAAADCLAIPRVNEARSSIDWYSPRAGMVVPWSAATEQERSDGLRELEQYHQQILTVVSRLDGVSDREKRIVQNLLGKVFVFPRPDCLYLVDGKPVLTFWGFQQGKDALADPFYALRSSGATAAAPAATALPPEPDKRRRPWWLWLLLLLLLAALLFWLLRACAPVPVTDPVLPGQNPELHDPSKPPQVVDPTQEPGVVGDVQRWWRSLTGGGVDGQGGVTDPDGQVVPGVDGTLPETVPDATVETPVDGVPPVEEGVVDPKVDPKAEPTVPPDGEAAPLTDPVKPEEAVTPEQSPGVDPSKPDPNKVDPTKPDPNALGNNTTPPNVPGAGLGQQMTIPADALKSGSVDFLNGQWRAAGGLQDAETGKPVRLQYQFDNGQAKVTVDRGNGIQCQGVSQSSIAGGKLQMSNQATVTKCSDGSNFVLPQVTCTPDASGKSQCTGTGQDGRALPITIRQMP